MTWKVDDPQGFECMKIRWELVPYTLGKVLDVGCGPRKPFEHFIGVDNDVDAHLFGIQARPDIKIDDAGDLSIFGSQYFDSVFSSHLLEHIEPERVTLVLKEWWRLTKQGGYLILYLPDEDEYPKLGEKGVNPDHKWNVNYERVTDYMRKVGGWDLVDFQKRNEEQEYSLFFVFKKIQGGKHHFSHQEPKPVKTCGVVRYGAFGDLMQASSVLKGLKDQGYHVTLYSTPPGSDVIAHDPNVNKFILQGKDQVPNHELGQFWKYIAKKYDKFVNLSESVEGTLLALPDRTPHGWNPLTRHSMMNRNYLEFQHQIAGVPHKPDIKFFSTVEERAWARKQREKMGGFVIMWVLAGSSVHKTWPHLDAVIAALMTAHPDIHVVLTGNMECKLLEAGWEKEKRVHLTCGVWSIRQTLSFIDQCDALIGPETGVLNAAACMSVPKVVFLSHSTHENLTRDWENVYPLAAENVSCPGRGENEAPACHQLHYGWDHCKKDGDTGTAVCQSAITPDRVVEILNRILAKFFQKAA